MANPNSRATLIDYCKRRLGDPVIEINVDEDQLEDRVDEALQYYQEYHSCVARLLTFHPLELLVHLLVVEQEEVLSLAYKPLVK